ncbi:hypothetical protein B0A49_06873 [Cryomyces minteri]|uniref:SUN domain-containing protein n=1 Tax=Cryomyces minteri TaxID=331657 RepID=A0A4U0WRA2_9PEZI|nr:hypothetical protein B0A49_06873 [Cryomyces minteri]
MLLQPIPTATPEVEAETESPLDNANFLSFEEWKKQNLVKAGQSPENIGQGRNPAGAPDGRRRPGINNALDALGEDSEIELDFGGFGNTGKEDEATLTWESGTKGATPTSQGDEGSSATVPASPRSRSRDAGKTCKERFNYASFDCAATVLKTNPQCRSASSVLVENKDSYMLNECAAPNKFIIVELCDDILVDTVVLANLEFFSSMFRTFRLSVSDRYPVKLDRWKNLGVYEARNSREVQAFLVENPLIWARYLRVEFLSHYGNEYYCPISLLRVHGTTMMEEFRHQEEIARGEDDVDEEDAQEALAATESAGQELTSAPVGSIKDTVTTASGVNRDSIDEVAAIVTSTPTSVVPSSTQTTSADTTHESAGSNPENHISQNEQPLNMSSTSQLHEVLRSVCETSGTAPSEVLLPSNSTAADTADTPSPATGVLVGSATANSVPAPALSTSNQTLDMPPGNAMFSSSHKSGASQSTKEETTSTPVTVSSKAPAHERPASSAVHPPQPNPTTQESFFKSIHKRLQMLEANSTLSLQYIEEQSRILRDAFVKVEKRQVAKTERFLNDLNTTVTAELRGFRQQYDQLWHYTVVELENQRDQQRREILAISSRLTILADELVFQKRLAIAQSTMVLLCLGLVLFARAGGGLLELPLMQQVMNKSQGALRSPDFSPPGSPSSGRSSSIRRRRKSFWRSSDNVSDESFVHGNNPSLSFSPPTPTSDEIESGTEGALQLDEEQEQEQEQELYVLPGTQSGPATPGGSRELLGNPSSWPDQLEINRDNAPDSSRGTAHQDTLEVED